MGLGQNAPSRVIAVIDLYDGLTRRGRDELNEPTLVIANFLDLMSEVGIHFPSRSQRDEIIFRPERTR
jgi:hypothetical protein